MALAHVDTARASDDGEIVVGLVGTTPHPVHPGGADIRRPVEAILPTGADPASFGPLLGRRLRTIALEDDCTRTSAEEVARRLVEAKAAVVLGHVCAAAAMAAAPIYSAAGTLFIAVGVRHPRLTAQRPGPLVLRMAGRSDRAHEDIARLIEARHAGARTAILHDRSAEARAFADTAEKRLAAAKPLRLDFVSGERGYGSLTERLAEAEIDVIVSPAQPVELGIMLDELARRGRRPTVYLSEPHAVPDLDAVAARHGDRLVLMLPWPAEVGADTTERRQRAVARLAGQAARAWLDAATRAGTTEAAAVVRHLAQATSPGLVAFDAAGDAIAPSYVPHRWTGGHWMAE